MLAQWNPLQDPDTLVSNFRLWRQALKMAEPDEQPAQQVQVFGSSTVVSNGVAM